VGDRREDVAVKNRIVLIGFSATGKSTVGRLLAQRLGWAYVDTDREIVRRAGKPIGEIFHGDGEDVFRDYELAELRRAARRRRVVVAVGGGAVLIERERAVMERSFFIVCLEARPETLYKRLLKDAETGNNPIAGLLVGGENPEDRIAFLKEYRQPYYVIARWTVHTDDLTPDEVAEEILHGWTYYARAHEGIMTPAERSKRRFPWGDARESDVPYAAKVSTQ
jgi:shikimate kinase